MNRPPEWDLFEKLDNKTISDDKFEHLQKRLKEDPELRKSYREYMDIVSALKDMAASQADEAWIEESLPKEKKRTINFPAITFAAIAALLAIIFIINVSKYKDMDPQPEYVEEIESGYAQIKLTANVQWQDTEFEAGSYLQEQTVKFEKGLLNLEFESGVEAIIEGPAEFKILNEMTMLVTSGKVRAKVPKSGHGFTIETDTIDIVDLGTEFGVEVLNGKVDVQVIDGLVKLQENKKDIKEIIAGKAFSIDQRKSIKELKFTPDRFKGVNELKSIKEELAQKALKRWNTFFESYKNDPSLLAYYSFFNKEKLGRKLPNDKSEAAESSFGLGKYITRSFDRFLQPGSSFLFDQNNSRVKINLPDKMDEMTMLSWVSIDSIENHYNTLLESQNRTPGAPGWYIRKRMMLLSLHRPNGTTILKTADSFSSPRVKGHNLRGTWMQLGVRITRDTIAFFRNGQKISEVENTTDYEYLQIGSAEIGNSYEQAKRRNLPLNFHGRMDELIIIKRALDDSEIRNIYKQGNFE